MLPHKIMHCGYELCFTGVARSKAMFQRCEDLAFFKVFENVLADDVFKQLARNAIE